MYFGLYFFLLPLSDWSVFQECFNTVGNYNCQCSEGFQKGKDGTCEEIAKECDIKAKKSKIKAFKGKNVNVKV